MAAAAAIGAAACATCCAVDGWSNVKDCKLKFKIEVRIKFEVKSEVKIEVDISSWRNLKMKKFNIETDNIITGKKENFNSEKVCLDDVKVKTEEIIILEWKIEYSVK